MPLGQSSFDKANRGSVTSYRGPRLKEGLRILAGLKAAGCRVLTDMHTPEQAAAAAEVGETGTSGSPSAGAVSATTIWWWTCGAWR